MSLPPSTSDNTIMEEEEEDEDALLKDVVCLAKKKMKNGRTSLILNHVHYPFSFMDVFTSFEKGFKAIEKYWKEKSVNEYPQLLELIRSSDTEENLMKYIILFMSRMTLVFDISYGLNHGYLSKRYLHEMHKKYATEMTSLDDGSSQCNRSLCSRDGLWFMMRRGYKNAIKVDEGNELNLQTYSCTLHDIAIKEVTTLFIKKSLVDALKGCKLVGGDVTFLEYAGKILALTVELKTSGSDDKRKMVLKEEIYEPEVYLKKEVYYFMTLLRD